MAGVLASASRRDAFGIRQQGRRASGDWVGSARAWFSFSRRRRAAAALGPPAVATQHDSTRTSSPSTARPSREVQRFRTRQRRRAAGSPATAASAQQEQRRADVGRHHLVGQAVRLEPADDAQSRDQQRPPRRQRRRPARQQRRRTSDQRHQQHAQRPERPLLEVALDERVVGVEDALGVGIDLVLQGDRLAVSTPRPTPVSGYSTSSRARSPQ